MAPYHPSGSNGWNICKLSWRFQSDSQSLPGHKIGNNNGFTRVKCFCNEVAVSSNSPKLLWAKFLFQAIQGNDVYNFKTGRFDCNLLNVYTMYMLQ